MRIRTRYLLFFLLILLLAYLYSCKKEAETGTLNIRLTDAPGDYQSVMLDIRKVKIHSDLSHPGADWIDMTTNSGIYDMISLSNGRDTLLAYGDLPAGTFHKIRIELGSSNSVTVTGGTFPLQVPGNKIEAGIGIVVRNGEESHLLVDLNAHASIRTDSAGNYILNPVIRVADLSQTGSIKGVIDPVIPNCMVYAITGFDSTLTFTGSNGEFKISGLDPGLYKVTAIPPAPTTPGTVPNVPVTAATVKDIGVVEVGQ